ncbi:hypothetical protein TorRG33x02_014550 [Trema orientale]|uniref:Uncharacterized protein n=1 Tax=Trema orientale TaxID=63057 RepID=A0A2P5FXE3_TREOI|nr:hypothetical protein TorRG33x02_014550 [Trema orientale]
MSIFLAGLPLMGYGQCVIMGRVWQTIPGSGTWEESLHRTHLRFLAMSSLLFTRGWEKNCSPAHPNPFTHYGGSVTL